MFFLVLEETELPRSLISKCRVCWVILKLNQNPFVILFWCFVEEKPKEMEYTQTLMEFIRLLFDGPVGIGKNSFFVYEVMVVREVGTGQWLWPLSQAILFNYETHSLLWILRICWCVWGGHSLDQVQL